MGDTVTVVKFRSVRRSCGWSEGEWKAIAEVFVHFGAIGRASDLETYETDQGDPWVAFIDPMGETVLVVAKVCGGGVRVTAGANQGQVLWDGPSLQGYLARIRSGAIEEVYHA